MINIKNLTVAFNSLSHAKSYVFTIIITLGITLGALVATFNLNYQLLAAPLPYPNADRLVVFKNQQFQNEQEVIGRFAPYPALVEAYKNKNDFFERKVIMSYTDSIERRMPDSPVLNTINVTPEYFDLFKVPLVLGRFFQSDEGLDSHIPVTVISYKTWVKLFGKDQDVLGKIINIMEIEFKIIGVVDEWYVEPGISATGWEADVWLPFDYDDMPLEFQKNWRTSMNNMFVVGLLKSNADLLAAEHLESTYINKRFKDELTGIEIITISDSFTASLRSYFLSIIPN
ncbi:MAG: hypothetical protein EOO07_17295 [Chitinophagaceae bacterium]|nr:MAG: hypothetical protein EOO07_17295 [Chitinophagaceae bacterium]